MATETHASSLLGLSVFEVSPLKAAFGLKQSVCELSACLEHRVVMTESLLQQYLVQQTLQVELQQLLTSCSSCLQNSANELLYDTLLQRAGFRTSSESLTTLQVYLLAETLPDTTSELTALSKPNILKANLPTDSLQSLGQGLRSDLDHQLGKRIEWLAQLLCFEGPTEQLPSHIQQLRAENASKEAETSALQAAINTSAAQLLEGVKTSVKLLLSIMSTYKLNHHTEHARAQALYLRSHCHTLLAKVASFEQRTLVDTYTADSIPALDAIARELTGAIDRAESDSREVKSKLEAYDQLGSDMLRLAAAHQDLDAELSHAQFTLHEFQRATLEDT